MRSSVRQLAMWCLAGQIWPGVCLCERSLRCPEPSPICYGPHPGYFVSSGVYAPHHPAPSHSSGRIFFRHDRPYSFSLDDYRLDALASEESGLFFLVMLPKERGKRIFPVGSPPFPPPTPPPFPKARSPVNGFLARLSASVLREHREESFPPFNFPLNLAFPAPGSREMRVTAFWFRLFFSVLFVTWYYLT